MIPTDAPAKGGENEAGHTPLPWRFVPWHIEEGPPAVRAPEGWVVAHTSGDNDAAFIARACNSHYDLLGALEEARRHLVWAYHYMKEPESHPIIRQIDSAIQRATKGGA